MDENPAVKLKTQFEHFHPTQFETYRNCSDELFMSALAPELLESRIQITSMLGGYHYAKVRDEYLCFLVLNSHNHRSDQLDWMNIFGTFWVIRSINQMRSAFIEKIPNLSWRPKWAQNKNVGATQELEKIFPSKILFSRMRERLQIVPLNSSTTYRRGYRFATYGWSRGDQEAFVTDIEIRKFLNIIFLDDSQRVELEMGEFREVIAETRGLKQALNATRKFVLQTTMDCYNEVFANTIFEISNEVPKLEKQQEIETENRRLREIAKKQAKLQREKKRKEKEAEEKKKQFLAEQLRKKEEADQRERQRIANIHDQHADLLASCRKNKISQEFIAALEKELKQSEFMCTWEQLLHDIWVPLGRPKQTEDWNAGLEWILSTIDWTGTAADAKLHITTKLENTVLPLQKAHADLITLLPGDQRTFQRLVALFSEQEFTNLDHQVVVGLLKKDDQAYTHLKQLAFQLLDIGTSDAKVNAIMTRLLEGEDEAFVLADEGVAFQT